MMSASADEVVFVFVLGFVFVFVPTMVSISLTSESVALVVGVITLVIVSPSAGSAPRPAPTAGVVVIPNAPVYCCWGGSCAGVTSAAACCSAGKGIRSLLQYQFVICSIFCGKIPVA